MRGMLLGNSSRFASGVVENPPPSVLNSDGAWLYKQTPTIDGLVVDERRGLGDARPELPGRAMSFDGTSQYAWIPVDPVTTFPFTLFGWANKTASTTRWLVSVSNPSDGAIYYGLGADDGDTVSITRRYTVTGDHNATVAMVSGWYSYLVVFQDATTALVYRNGILIHIFSGITAVPVGPLLTRFAVGTYRTSSPGIYWNGRAMNCGFLRRAATLQDAIDFHNTGIISDAEVLLPLDNNSTTVSYNIGRSSSWWLNEPRRNLLSYTQDLTNAAWRKAWTTTPLANRIVETADTAEHRIDSNAQFSVTAGQVWSFSFSAKLGERTRVRAGFDSLGILNARAFFDLSNGTVDNTIAGSVYAITPDTSLGAGWYRCTVTSTAIGAGNVRVELNLVNGTGGFATTVSYLGDVSNGVFVTNMQLDLGAVTAYQPVLGSGIEYPEATLVNAPTSYIGSDVPFSRQNEVGYSTRRNLLHNSENVAAWSFTNASGTATRVGNVFTTGASPVDRVIRGNTTITAGTAYTSSVTLSGSGSVRIFNIDGAGNTTLGTAVTLTSTPTTYTGTSTLVSGGSSGGVGIYNSAAGTAGTVCTIHNAQLVVGSIGTEYQRIGADPGTTVLFPALLDDPTKSAATDTLEFQGEAPRNLQAQDAPCLVLNGTNQNVLMDLDTVAGPELVTNGDFSNGSTGWSSLYAGASITGGQMVFDGVTSIITGGPAMAVNTLSAPMIAGRLYLVTYTIVGGTTNPISIGGVNNIGTPRTAAGTYTEAIIPTITGTSSLIVYSRVVTGVRTGAIDNVSVKELPSPLVEKLSSTLVINGGFDTDTNWTKGTGWTISGGVAVASSVSAFSSIIQNSVPFLIGRRYKIAFTVVSVTSGGVRPIFTGGTQVTGTSRTTTGTYVEYLTTVTGNVNFAIQANSSGFDGTVDNVIVEQVAEIDSEGTSALSYLPDGTGFTGTAGTAWKVQFGGVTRFPCSDKAGSNIYDVVGNVACGISNPASNWTTQDSYFYGLHYGYSDPKEQLGPELRQNGVVGLVGTATAATYNTATGDGTVTRVDVSNQSFVSFSGLTDGYYQISITNTGVVSIRVRSGTHSGSVITDLSSGQSATVFGSPTSNQLTITNTASAGTATFTLTSLRSLPAHPNAQIPASATNVGFDANGGTNPLTHPAGSWHNSELARVGALQPEAPWTYGRQIPGLDGDPLWHPSEPETLGDIVAKLDQANKVGKLVLSKRPEVLDHKIYWDSEPLLWDTFEIIWS